MLRTPFTQLGVLLSRKAHRHNLLRTVLRPPSAWRLRSNEIPDQTHLRRFEPGQVGLAKGCHADPARVPAQQPGQYRVPVFGRQGPDRLH